MPVPFASPDSVKYVGATPSYMTPRTPKTPDEYGSNLARKAGFPHLKPSQNKDGRSKYQTQIDRSRENGLKRLKQRGSAFNAPLPPESKHLAKDLLTIGQTSGIISFGRLESFSEFSRTRDTQAASPDFATMIHKNTKAYWDNVHRAAVAYAKEQRAIAYLEMSEEAPSYPATPSGSSGPNKTGGKTEHHVIASNPGKAFMGRIQHQFEVLERLEHSEIKTRTSAMAASRRQKRLAQLEARRKTEALDQVPTTYAAWKLLDESRQARVARFLQLPDDQKDADVTQKRWDRNDAMALNQQYKNEPQFQAEVSAVLAKRVTTDPRRRPTLTNTANPPLA